VVDPVDANFRVVQASSAQRVGELGLQLLLVVRPSCPPTSWYAT
jgi:hypothetical protein